ncbi:MAG: S1 RNA-binding domain-containing protein [Oscillospiraceae bacterium]|jgi:small subunit ribosomal protein S1|nr:S1 RNA-binding domain-containing protein [Oscillospiraceae bacterium]
MNAYPPEGQLLMTAENRKYTSSPAGLHEALAAGITLEGRVLLCDNEHNLHVDLGCMRGIIPRTEGALGIAEGEVRDIALISRVNKPVMVHITGFDVDEKGQEYANLSRVEVQKECLENFINKLEPGDIIDARVSHMENFGVFADVGAGVNALLPIDAVSVSRIPHPNARFLPGQMFRAIVKGRDDQNRLLLSHKELLGTWEENAALFAPGETVPGIVRSVEKYGVFVELTPNLAGLAEFSETVQEGDHACVYIKSILPERMKIKLIIVDSFSASYPPAPMRYFIEGDHIDKWTYSPQCSQRATETIFTASAQA